MNKVDQVFKIVVGVAIILSTIICSYEAGRLSVPNNEPTNDLFWIDNDRVHKDSVITSSPIYNDMEQQIGIWIKVTYQGENVFIECLDKEGTAWDEWYESWLNAFKEGTE